MPSVTAEPLRVAFRRKVREVALEHAHALPAALDGEVVRGLQRLLAHLPPEGDAERLGGHGGHASTLTRKPFAYRALTKWDRLST